MANIKTGICPACGKDRELAFFKFGVIQTTLCIYCLKRYLDSSVIPRLIKNSDISDDVTLITGNSNE